MCDPLRVIKGNDDDAIREQVIVIVVVVVVHRINVTVTVIRVEGYHYLVVKVGVIVTCVHR